MALLDINVDRGVEIASNFQSQGARAYFYRCDVRDQAGCKSAVDQFVTDHCGSSGVHTLFNNAATFLCKGLDASTADFQHALMTNVAGYAHMVQGQARDRTMGIQLRARLAPAHSLSALCSCILRSLPLSAVHSHMLVASKSRKGVCSIINNSSTSASRPQMSHWTYSSSKGGIKQLTRCMALDFGGQGIRVNSISPSWTWSPEVMKAAAEGGKEKWDPIWGKFHVSPHASHASPQAYHTPCSPRQTRTSSVRAQVAMQPREPSPTERDRHRWRSNLTSTLRQENGSTTPRQRPSATVPRAEQRPRSGRASMRTPDPACQVVSRRRFADCCVSLFAALSAALFASFVC